MSHFSVLVVTKTGDRDELERALQPFHEYECTGIEDQYVVEVDKTDEVNELYSTRTETKWVDADGEQHSPYADQFYREAKPGEDVGRLGGSGWNGKVSFTSKDWGDGLGYRPKIHMTAEEAGMKEIEVLVSDGQSIADFAADYGGWYERDGRFYDKTNPNARWDWWVIGGRCAGRLLAMGLPGRHDRLKVQNVDFETLRIRAVKARRQQVAAICNESGMFLSELTDALAAKKELHELWLKTDPRPRGDEYEAWARTTGEIGARCCRISSKTEYTHGLPELAPGQSVEEWIEAAPAISFFAALKDGNWYEQGKMGWFAFVADEKEADAWERVKSEFLAGLQPDEWITFVDCHI